MFKRRLATLLVPATTFILGILIQSLLDQWITSKNIIFLSQLVILFSSVVVFIFMEFLYKRFDIVDTKLETIEDTIKRSSIHLEYLEDSSDGKSYQRATELVKLARFSIIAVGNWEKFPDYQVNKTSINVGQSNAINARRDFYEALNRQIANHQESGNPFYRRIIQVSEEHIDKRVPFETDPVFFSHLLYVAKYMLSDPSRCLMRKTTLYFNLQFTIIDERYIIIPILTTIKNLLQARYGALIIDDTRQELVRRLTSIYWNLESRAKPIELSQLESSN